MNSIYREKLKKIKEDRNEVFLGTQILEIINDPDFVSYIHQRGEECLYNLAANPNLMKNFPLIVSLSIIGLTNYDGVFYEYVHKTYSDIYGEHYSQRLDNLIRERINDYFPPGKDDVSRVVTRLLKNVFVPKYFLPDFFEFMYDIFASVYFYRPFDTSDEELLEERDSIVKEDLTNIFSNLFKDSDDDSSDILKVSDGTSFKEYKLIASTKLLFRDRKYIEDVVEFSFLILRIINNSEYGADVNQYLKNDYLRYGYSEWHKKKSLREAIIQNGTQRRTKRHILVPSFSRYNYNNQKVYIKTKSHIISNATADSRFSMTIYNGRKPLITYDEELITSLSMGSIVIDSLEIEIESPLGELLYVLKQDGDTIYRSGNKLFKNILVFDKSGNHINKIYQKDSNIFILSKERLQLEDFEIFKRPNFIEYRGSASEDIINKINEIKNYKPSVDTAGVVNHEIKGLFAKIGNKKIKVYNQVNSLFFKTTTNPGIFHLRINDIITQPNLYSYETSEDYDGMFLTRINTEDLFKKSGFYNVKIGIGKESNSFEHDFLVDSLFSFDEDKKEVSSYFDSQHSLSTNLISLINEELYTPLIHTFKFDDKEISYEYNYPIPRMSLDQENYYYLTKNINYYDILDNLYFYGLDIDNVSIIANRGRLFGSLPVEKDNDYEYRILKYELDNYTKYNHKSFLLTIKTTDNKKLNLTIFKSNTYNEAETFLERKNDLESNEYELNIHYEGLNQVQWVIRNFNNQLIKEGTTDKKGKQIIELPESNFYRLEIYEDKSRDFFAENEIQFVYEYNNFTINDLLNNTISLRSGYLNDELTEMVLLYKHFINIEEVIDHYTAKGQLIYDDGEESFTKSISLEILGKITRKRIELAIFDLDNDGLLFDNELKRISFEPNDSFVDIYQYEGELNYVQ